MKKKIVHMALYFLTVRFLFALDQWTKSLAVKHLKGHGPHVLLDGIFEFLYSENRGAAFGILQGKQVFFSLIAVLVLLAVIYALWKLPVTKKYLPMILCLLLIASGAAGNLIDRLSEGYVVDFLYFSLIDFPIFNVADCYVTVSTVLLFVLLFFGFYSDEDLAVLLPGRKESE